MEQAEGVLPFEWNIFKREPTVVRYHVRVNERRTEESMETRKKEWKVRKAIVLYLCIGVSLTRI